jgi:hypothetical protein
MPHIPRINYPKIGDIAQSSRYNYTGFITRIKFIKNKDWLDAQEIPLTRNERLEPFVSIDVISGGSVDVPISSLL